MIRESGMKTALFFLLIIYYSSLFSCSLSLWVKADVKWKNSQCCSMPLNPRLSLTSSSVHNQNDRHKCHENGLSYRPCSLFPSALLFQLAAQLSKKN